LEYRLPAGTATAFMDGYALTGRWKFRRQAELLLPRATPYIVRAIVEEVDGTRVILEPA
jgi:t-SNARE complex subunit (syntaxin)